MNDIILVTQKQTAQEQAHAKSGRDGISEIPMYSEHEQIAVVQIMSHDPPSYKDAIICKTPLNVLCSFKSWSAAVALGADVFCLLLSGNKEIKYLHRDS